VSTHRPNVLPLVLVLRWAPQEVHQINLPPQHPSTDLSVLLRGIVLHLHLHLMSRKSEEVSPRAVADLTAPRLWMMGW
jgi:hypothetical protein